jgi:hypothetical protein
LAISIKIVVPFEPQRNPHEAAPLLGEGVVRHDSTSIVGADQAAQGCHAMGMALSSVGGEIAPERVDEVLQPYRNALAEGPPSDLSATYLLCEGHGTVAIMSVWHIGSTSRRLLESGEEPFARRLIREAGGELRAEFFDRASLIRAAAS